MDSSSEMESTQRPGQDESQDDAIWLRGFFMLLFVMIHAAAEVVVGLVAVIQFGWIVLANERNARLLTLGESLSEFVYQIVRYWTFASDAKPFPFSEWPRREAAEASSA